MPNSNISPSCDAFYFMRHGETDWNQKHLFMGWQDIPLNERGLEQAHEAANLLRPEPITYVISSPLLRAHKTAEIVAQALQVPLIAIAELKECHWGKYEGTPINEDLIKAWLEGRCLENGESPEVFETRVTTGFQKALSFKGPVLIVAHGGVYAALKRVCEWPHRYLENATPYCHEPPKIKGDPWSIIRLQDNICL